MRMNTNYITAAVAITLLWIIIMVAYLGLLDEPRAQITSLRQRYHVSAHPIFDDHSELKLPVALNNNNNDISKEMQEEQFSLNKIPEVDLEKLSIVQNQQEQVMSLHFCTTC